MTDDVISLKEYIDTKLENLEKAMNAKFESVTQATNSALAAADKAINKSDIAVEKRLDSVNEFRAALTDQQRTLMPRSEVEILIKGVESKTDSNEKRIITLESKGVGIGQGWGIAVGVIGLVAAVIAIISRFF